MPSRARRYIGSSVMSRSPRRTRPSLGRMLPDDHVEGGGLAGAVRAEQPDDLAGCDRDVHVAHHVALAVALAQVDAGEGGHSEPPVAPQRLHEQPRAPDRIDLLRAEVERDPLALEMVVAVAQHRLPLARELPLGEPILRELALRRARALAQRDFVARDQPVGLRRTGRIDRLELARAKLDVALLERRRPPRSGSAARCRPDRSPRACPRAPRAAPCRAPARPPWDRRRTRRARPRLSSRWSSTSVPPSTRTLLRARSNEIVPPASRSSASQSSAGLPVHTSFCAGRS